MVITYIVTKLITEMGDKIVTIFGDKFGDNQIWWQIHHQVWWAPNSSPKMVTILSLISSPTLSLNLVSTKFSDEFVTKFGEHQIWWKI